VTLEEYQRRLDEANELAEAGQVGRAAEIYSDLLAADPENPAPLFARGAAYIDAGLHVQAIEDLQRFIELEGELPEALFNLGLALDVTGNREEGIAALRRALEINPEYGRAYFALGNCYFGLAEYQKAIAAYRRGEAFLPKSGSLHYQLGEALFRSGAYEEAIEQFERALVWDYADEAIKGFAKCCFSLGDDDRAKRLFQEILLRDPDDDDLRLYEMALRRIHGESAESVLSTFSESEQ
jgi:tetratricopeptide (TPR) repeat protein